MKYWAYFVGKLAVAVVLLRGLWPLFRKVLPRSEAVSLWELNPMGHDLSYTLGVYAFALLAAGVFYGIVHDQRLRCRTCLRKLRMPINRGSWNHMLLLGAPHTEYICPYGHGTLKVPDLHLTGSEPLKWAEHQDIWKELETLDARK